MAATKYRGGQVKPPVAPKPTNSGIESFGKETILTPSPDAKDSATVVSTRVDPDEPSTAYSDSAAEHIGDGNGTCPVLSTMDATESKGETAKPLVAPKPTEHQNKSVAKETVQDPSPGFRDGQDPDNLVSTRIDPDVGLPTIASSDKSTKLKRRSAIKFKKNVSEDTPGHHEYMLMSDSSTSHARESTRSDSSGYTSSELGHHDSEDEHVYEDMTQSDVTRESSQLQTGPSGGFSPDSPTDESEDDERCLYMNKDLFDVTLMYHKREKVAAEILKTEEVYVSSLETMVKASWQLDGANKAVKLVSKEDMKSMLPPTESILKLHREYLLPDLREKIRAWKDEPTISEVWKKYIPMFKMYQSYVQAADTAMKCQQKLRAKNSALDTAFKTIESQPEFKMLAFMSLLLQPIQRLPRYVLLLQSYKKYLPKSDLEYEAIALCIDQLEAVVRLCDSAMNLAALS